MEIKAKCKYDYETCKAVSRIDAYRKSNPKKVFVSRAVLCICLLVLNFIVVGFSEMSVGYGVDVVVALVLLIDTFVYFAMPKIQYNSMSKMKDVENNYVFYDDEFTAASVSEHLNAKDTLKYSIMVKAYETEKYFFIYISKRQLFTVDKSTLEGGTAEDLRKKLSSVLGKKYIRCKY